MRARLQYNLYTYILNRNIYIYTAESKTRNRLAHNKSTACAAHRRHTELAKRIIYRGHLRVSLSELALGKLQHRIACELTSKCTRLVGRLSLSLSFCAAPRSCGVRGLRTRPLELLPFFPSLSLSSSLVLACAQRRRYFVSAFLKVKSSPDDTAFFVLLFSCGNFRNGFRANILYITACILISRTFQVDKGRYWPDDKLL